MKNNMEIRNNQEYFIRNIDKYDMIVVEWRVSQGIDFTLEEYMNRNEDKTFGYIGLNILFEQYDVNNIKKYNMRNFEGSHVDVLIFEIINNSNYFNFILDYCISHNIKVIMKKNYRDLDLSGYNYHYSDGTRTKEQDRLKKLERILED